MAQLADAASSNLACCRFESYCEDMNKKQKKIVITFDIDQMIKEGKVTIMPPEVVAQASARINAEMKKVSREVKRKLKKSEIRASKIILNA